MDSGTQGIGVGLYPSDFDGEIWQDLLTVASSEGISIRQKVIGVLTEYVQQQLGRSSEDPQGVPGNG